MKTKIDYSLCLVTDRKLMSTPTLEMAVEQAILGGCTLIQLREKDISTKEFFELACKVKRITDKYKIPFIINDRIDIAMAVDADGVHIGSDDMPTEEARRIIGEDKILGVSARTVEEAILAEINGADYLGVGAMFATDTKNDALIVSKEELQKISSICTIPILVIGGIREDRIPYFDAIKIDGLAVISAIISSKNILAATQKLKDRFCNRPAVPEQYIDIDYVFFDLDGTLFDSNDLWEKIDIEFLSKRGYDVPDDYIVKVSALNFREAAVYTKQLFNLPDTPQELIEEWRKMAQNEYEYNFLLKPHAKEYLFALKKQGVRLAVATSLPPSLYVPALKNNGIYELFDNCFSAEDCNRGKEHSDFFIEIMQQVHSLPQKCLFFEDVLSAIKSIKRTGAKVCGVYDYFSRSDVSEIILNADFYIVNFRKAPMVRKI